MTEAARTGRAEAVKLLASLGLDLSWEHPDGGTALHRASWWGRPNVVRALLKVGAPLNVRDSTYGSSPIAWTAHGSPAN
jgi:ankyrin repeat protein